MSKTAAFCIGTHAAANQDSISRCEADFERGEFRTVYHMQGITGPTYLAGPAGDVIYTIGSTSGGGAVYALAQGSSGSKGEMSLSMINSFPSGGSGPCHISVDSRREFLLCANYVSGSIALYDLAEDGRIISMCDFRQYKGTGFDAGDRQAGPHAHFAAFHVMRSEVLVCDLGLDMVYVYELDRDAAKLRDTDRSIRLPAGSGPRHLTFSRDKINADGYVDMLYILTEMANTIFVYQFEKESGQYRFVQQMPAAPGISEDGTVLQEMAAPQEALMVPPTADNDSIGCAIRFSEDEKYLFVSSRLGYQSITAFRREPDGTLTYCSRCLCGGITPRDFNVFSVIPEPPAAGTAGNTSAAYGTDTAFAADYILAANQDSDLITALAFDRDREKLTLLDMRMPAIKPTCIVPVF